MAWEKGDFEAVDLSGFSGDQFATIYGKNMQVWWPTEVPEDATYFMLGGLRLITDGNMAVHVSVVDENALPVSGVEVIQGWQDGPEQPPDFVPNGGDPRGYPNRGNMAVTSSIGNAEWVWGMGEGCDLAKVEGPHWYWIPKGPKGYYTDVVYGFGWLWGTNHYHVEPIFIKTTGGGGYGGDLEEVLSQLFADLAEAFAKASAALG